MAGANASSRRREPPKNLHPETLDLTVSLRLSSFVRSTALIVLVMTSGHAGALSPEQVFELASSSIVRIAVLDEQGTAVRQGSGIVVRAGEVVANCRAVAGDARALVVSRGTKWALAQLVATDTQRNLCHLRWRGEEAIGQPVKGIVAIDNLRKGQVAYAVGSPRGLELGLSSGLVSGFRRHPERGMVIDVDTPIASEASGGGLFDREGRLIGFTAIMLTAGQKLDFAVPASAAFDLLPSLRTRRIVPVALTPKDERADREQHVRLQSEAARVTDARRFLEAERIRVERERELGEEERQKTPIEAPPASGAAEPPADTPPVAEPTAAPVPEPAPTPALSPVLLQVIGERVEKALAGSTIPFKAWSLDFTMALDPNGRVAKLTLDRSSGDRGVDNTVATRLAKAGPYRDASNDPAEGPLTVSLRVGWFHDHAAVVPMAGALPSYGMRTISGSSAAAAGPSLSTTAPSGPVPQPDAEAERAARELEAKEREAKEREAKELAAKQQRAEEEQRALKRKAEAEQLLRARDDERRAQREAAETEAGLAVTAGAHAYRLVEDYTIRVREAIGAQFLIPPSAPNDARAEIEFRVLPNGQVGGLRFVKKSGNAAFDKAIEQAIERARPLPVPQDAAVYPQFRDQRLVFTGER